MLSGNFQGWNKNWFVLTFFWAAKKKILWPTFTSFCTIWLEDIRLCPLMLF